MYTLVFRLTIPVVMQRLEYCSERDDLPKVIEEGNRKRGLIFFILM